MLTPKSHPRFLAHTPSFDPLAGQVVREPVGSGQGYWAGAPSVYYDPVQEQVYLLYRIRRPRGVHPDRGAEVHLAVSKNGVDFEDFWTLEKSQLDSTSIERCSLTQSPAGAFLLYISYVDAQDNRWRTDVVAAKEPAQLDVTTRQKVLTAADIGAEGVKDPWVISLGGVYFMLLSYATVEGAAADDQLHGTCDCYNTGLIKSRTGLATSLDGVNYQWQGDLFSPTHCGWDCYAARISCLWYRPPVWLAFYDGSASVDENYEERCGLAIGTDLRHLLRVTDTGPWVTVPHASGSVRYMDILPLPGRTLFYYEMARPDGGHELRVFEYPA